MVMKEKEELLNLISELSGELGVALEMCFMPDEFNELWGEALEALKKSVTKLESAGLAVPPVVYNVIAAAEVNKDPPR